MKHFKAKAAFGLSLLALLTALLYFLTGNVFPARKPSQKFEGNLTEEAEARTFDVELKTIGELEAAKSISIASMIRGDWGKVIYLVNDGVSVNEGDILVKFDTTPFEEYVEDVSKRYTEEHNKLEGLHQMLDWEIYQAQQENKTAKLEIEAAQLEIIRAVKGDGPMEEARLKSAMLKALTKYDEIKGYSDDLVALQAQDFLNPIELKQAEKKLAEEEDAYLSAKAQYETYINYVYPIQVKKAEAALEKAENKCEEVTKGGHYKVTRAETTLNQAKRSVDELARQLNIAQEQMKLAEIHAPSTGMVVLKEDFRHGQRRKPRIGDVLLKNQSILDLPDLDHMLVKTKVREVDLYKIQIDTPASIEVDAYPQAIFYGKVQSIGVLAVADALKTGDEKYFDLIVAIETKDQRLRPGMTARVTLHAYQVKNQLTIPIQAVFEFDKKSYCFVSQNNDIVIKPVKVGYSNDQWIEVKAGLAEREEVLLNMPKLNHVSNFNEVVRSHL